MIKGYKATYNYKCRGQVYEIGQEYKLDQKPILCNYGFHYCLDARNTLFYYTHTHEFKLLEIEDFSNDTVTDNDKSCSNHIRIVREIADLEELLQLLGCVYTFDKNGNEAFYKNSTGYWREQTYDEFGRELTYKNSIGDWREQTWNEKHFPLLHKSSSGFWREYTYDESGQKLLTYTNSDGEFRRYIYNENGRMTDYVNY